MTDTQTEERLTALEKEALAFANFLRARDNDATQKTLAQGFRRHTSACPIAVTAGEGWEIGEGGAIKVGPRGGQRGAPVPLPAAVVDFMAAFDAGMYPQLDVELDHEEAPCPASSASAKGVAA